MELNGMSRVLTTNVGSHALLMFATPSNTKIDRRAVAAEGHNELQYWVMRDFFDSWEVSNIMWVSDGGGRAGYGGGRNEVTETRLDAARE